jgi:hypothetical protein
MRCLTIDGASTGSPSLKERVAEINTCNEMSYELGYEASDTITTIGTHRQTNVSVSVIKQVAQQEHKLHRTT